jgi:aryl-alcohol dehydrogenase-like predicted oxidoreductase
MLEVAKAHGFKFDTAQMPLNVLDAHFRSFERSVVPACLREGVGVLGMKSMGDGLVLKSKTATPVECLRYALSLPTSVVITGIDSMTILKQALDVVRAFRPMAENELAALLARTKRAAMTGEFERFKTTNAFDGTAKNPAWLGEPDKGPG